MFYVSQLKKLFTITCLTMLVSMSIMAEEHKLTDITGTQIQLKSADHAIAGSIKDFVIFGNKSEETGISELTIKKNGKIIKATFGKMGASMGGVITQEINGQTHQVRLEIVKINVQEQTIAFKLNGQLFTAYISADDYINNHFINPSYRVMYEGGELSFKMHDGQACYGFSSHLLMMIVGSYFLN